MKVLMFGWEFPPHISGGLGTACYGITKALAEDQDIDLTFIVPKAYGNEPKNRMKLKGANEVNLINSKIEKKHFKVPFTYVAVESGIVPYVDPADYEKFVQEKTLAENFPLEKSQNPLEFTGKYGPNLMTEIHNFSIVAEHIAKQEEYDIIHAHDWLTFPAGVLAKKATGKPLVVHVHATDFDRSGGNVNPDVFEIEKHGMQQADGIFAVSNHTKRIIAEKYRIDESKIFTVHNGVEPLSFKSPRKSGKTKKTQTVTFLGRITLQKGPQYFVDMAKKVLSRMPNVEFVMAGSGDMMRTMIELVSHLGISNKFRFPGFLKGDEVWKMLARSDIYIMPSVSEPFGISPLEAMQCRVPVIISKQSGVSEVIHHAIKLDFWDTDAMADAVYNILHRSGLKKMLKRNGHFEVNRIRWDKSASQIKSLYKNLVTT